MAGRVTTLFERYLTTTVNDIEHIEANSLHRHRHRQGVLPARRRRRGRQCAGHGDRADRACGRCRPASTPPLILNYNAATVPILQLALSGEGMTEQKLFDLGINMVRTPLVTVPGAAMPYPYGGKQRQVQIDLDPAALQARGLSAADVANALAAQNLIAADRHAEDRRHRVPVAAEQRAVGDRGARRPADQDSRTAPRSTSATWRTCTTATRRRPTSCTSTATARC